MEKSLLLESIGDTPVLRVIDFLMENRLHGYTKDEIAEGAGLSRAALFNNWKRLEFLGVVRESRRQGRTRRYALNGASAITRLFEKLEMGLIERAAGKRSVQLARAAA